MSLDARSTLREPWALAAAGVVLAIVLVVLGALLGGWRPGGSGGGDADVLTFGPGGDLAEFTLFDGQCASGELAAGGGFGVPSDTPCGNPHDVEVIASAAPIGEGRPVDYPGADALADYGRAYCSMIADSRLIQDSSSGVDRDDLDVTVVIPSEAAFLAPDVGGPAAGARQVSCVVSRADGEKLTDRFAVI